MLYFDTEFREHACSESLTDTASLHSFRRLIRAVYTYLTLQRTFRRNPAEFDDCHQRKSAQKRRRFAVELIGLSIGSTLIVAALMKAHHLLAALLGGALSIVRRWLLIVFELFLGITGYHARWILLTGLLAVHAGLLSWEAYRFSPTLNEPGHLVAGLSNWSFRRFDIYCVNPPLTRLIAALPVIAAGYKQDWTAFYNEPGARPEFGLGQDFVHANGSRSLWLFAIARFACIPISVLGGLLCFLWAREVGDNDASGFLALALWCFEPNILGHGALITPDCAAASFGLGAGYAFWRWLKEPSLIRAVVSGFALGFAELSKLSWIILFVVWPFLWLVLRWTDSWHSRGIKSSRSSVYLSCLQQVSQLALILGLAIYVINCGYGFEGTFTRLGDFDFVSDTLSGKPPTADSGNRFRDTFLAGTGVPFPRHYVRGIDIQQGDLEQYHYASYLRGEWHEYGWWYYYIYGLAVKTPHGTQFLFLLSVFALLGHCCFPSPRQDKSRSPRGKDIFFILTPAAALLLIVSSQHAFTHHLRYVLPLFGFGFVFIGSTLGRVFWVHDKSRTFTAPILGKLLEVRPKLDMLWSNKCELARRAIVALLSATIVSSCVTYPHTMSYFNELAGGPAKGHLHLLGSNLDWGQELLFLKDYCVTHYGHAPIGLLAYGGFDPRDIGIRYYAPDMSFEHKASVAQVRPGSALAVSVNFLMGDTHAPNGLGSPRDNTTFCENNLLSIDRGKRIGHTYYLFEQ